MTFPASKSRDRHARWLVDIGDLPTAAGREWRVVEWIERWLKDRPDLKLDRDQAGNLTVRAKRSWGKRGSAPIYITAHLDHPAFVVRRVIGPGTVELEFRGGVMDEYFKQARIVIHASDPTGASDPRPPRAIGATLEGEGDGVHGADGSRLFKTYVAEVDGADDDDAGEIRVGDVAVWALPPGEIDAGGIVHIGGSDDLSAVAAALSAIDVLRELNSSGEKTLDVRLLFTRSEEIGFTGAIAACKLGTMPKGARVIALENSRSFADSPIGGGPIVRVGDRMSVFDPRLTAACAKRAEQISGNAAAPTAQQKMSEIQGWKWQRKLMAGGACEATVYCMWGYQATCLCLPLGNYHNMADLASVQDGTYDAARLGPPRVGREYIALSDYHGLIDLLVAIGQELPTVDPGRERIEKLYSKHEYVLNEGARAPSTKKPTVRKASRKAPVKKSKRPVRA